MQTNDGNAKRDITALSEAIHIFQKHIPLHILYQVSCVIDSCYVIVLPCLEITLQLFIRIISSLL